MSLTNTAESDLLALIFQNTNMGLVGDATGLRGSSTAGSLYISLHSSDPGEGGSQTTNEISYTGYARVGVARNGSQWTVSGTAPTQVQNTNVILFGECTVGSATAAYFGVGTDSSGAGKLLISGQLTAPLAISVGITPQFAANQLTVTAD
jgi:hypothetical protein